MQTIKCPLSLGLVTHDHIRTLMIERFEMLRSQFHEPYDPAQHGWFLMVEEGDELDSVEKAGCPALLLDSDEIAFGEPDYFSPYEFCVDHGDCYELVRVLSDYGEAVCIFIPKSPAIAAPLLQLCASLSKSSN